MDQCAPFPSAATKSPVMHIAVRVGVRSGSAEGSILGYMYWVGAASFNCICFCRETKAFLIHL